MNVYINREIVEDVLNKSYTRTVFGSNNGRYGICFTANNSYFIEKVYITHPNTSGTLRIAKGSSSTSEDGKADYTISSGGEFTLPIPYEIKANTDYIIVIQGSNIGIDDVSPFPKVCAHVTFNYGVNSNAPDYQYTNMVTGIGAITSY